MMAQGRFSLKGLGHLPEAQEMVGAMLAAQPAKRPNMQGIMAQPFWWSPARRLAFLIHLSDRVETEDREVFLIFFISKFTSTFYHKNAEVSFFLKHFTSFVSFCFSSLCFHKTTPSQHHASNSTPLRILEPPLPTVINTLPPMYRNIANFRWLKSIKLDMCPLPC